MTVEENKAIAHRVIEQIINHGNMAAFEELVADLILGTREALPDLHMVIEDMVAEGDRVAIRVRAEATHTREFLGVPATGRRISWTGIGILRIVGGRMVGRWNESDIEGVIEQMKGDGAPPSR